MAVADLHDTFECISTGKAAKRLMIALACKDGVSVETLSERYGIPRSTVYYWFDRFEGMSIEAAIQDDDRPGRPPALTLEERDKLRADLVKSPRTFGFDAASWSTETVRDHIEDRYGVTYSDGHIRRLLRSGEIASTKRRRPDHSVRANGSLIQLLIFSTRILRRMWGFRFLEDVGQIRTVPFLWKTTVIILSPTHPS